jgi:hypothetical protein
MPKRSEAATVKLGFRARTFSESALSAISDVFIFSPLSYAAADGGPKSVTRITVISVLYKGKDEDPLLVKLPSRLVGSFTI